MEVYKFKKSLASTDTTPQAHASRRSGGDAISHDIATGSEQS